MRRVLLFIISLLISEAVSAQVFRFDGFRLGLDPVRSMSLLLKDKQKNMIYLPKTFEGYGELLIFGNTSIVAEAGLSKTFLQLPSKNYQYWSEGHYKKLGLDFNITHPHDKAEITIGWRAGMSSYREHAQIILWNEYHGEGIIQPMAENRKKILWGELLITHKYRLFEHPVNHNKIYFAFTLKVKSCNKLPGDPYPSLVIPGYGFYKKYTPGMSFALLFHYQAKRNAVKDLKRRNLKLRAQQRRKHY